jgi:DNA-binding MarR family transcriptional regulator
MMLLSADERRVLAMLLPAGNAGIAQAVLSAQGFDASMIADLVNRGLATLMTERILDDGKLTAVAMVRITEAGRRALSAEN